MLGISGGRRIRRSESSKSAKDSDAADLQPFPAQVPCIMKSGYKLPIIRELRDALHKRYLVEVGAHHV
jgi:hypothetical protein